MHVLRGEDNEAEQRHEDANNACDNAKPGSGVVDAVILVLRDGVQNERGDGERLDRAVSDGFADTEMCAAHAGMRTRSRR